MHSSGLDLSETSKSVMPHRDAAGTRLQEYFTSKDEGEHSLFSIVTGGTVAAQVEPMLFMTVCFKCEFRGPLWLRARMKWMVYSHTSAFSTTFHLRPVQPLTCSRGSRM